MKRLTLIATLLVSAAGLAPLQAAAQHGQSRIVNPCERGPIPEWSVINYNRDRFVTSLLQARPNMPREVAENIAYQVCDDLTMLYDDAALTRRTNYLIRQAGY
jgi:hypothetical protein